MSSFLATSPGQPDEPSAPKSLVRGCCVYFRSPFFLAVEEGDASEVIKFLNEDVMWLKLADKKEKRTAWHIAAANGHVEVLQALVARAREDDVRMDWSTSTSLPSRIRAAATGRDSLGPDERVAEFVNVRAGCGVSPLTLAAQFDHVDVVKYLLTIGADPWQGDQEGRNPAHYAAKAGAIKALQVLLEEEKPMSHRASNRNYPGTRYVDSLDTFGFSPLHYATWANRKAAMMLLIGFDANLITRSTILHAEYYNLPAGSTPLHIACLLGDLDRVKLLLRAYYETAADLLPSQTALLGTVERRRRARSHPDPRLILTRTQRLPFHIASRAGHRHLLDWLDPSVPLMFLFGGEEDTPGAPVGQGGIVALVGVSRLTVIAAKALHQALLDSLDAAAVDIHRIAEEAEARRRRREERRIAREAKAAAQSLEQGKEPPPDWGIRGRIRRLIQRASGDGGGGALGTAATTGGGRNAAASGEPHMKGWRPWRSRTRRGRRTFTSSGLGDGATGVASGAGLEGSPSQGHPVCRSPRRRRRRSTLDMPERVVSTRGLGGRRVASLRGNGSEVANGNTSDGVVEGPNGIEQLQLQPESSQEQRGSATVLNSSSRLHLNRNGSSQRSHSQQLSAAPQQRPSISGRAVVNVAVPDGLLEGSEAAVGRTIVGSPITPVMAGTGMADGGLISASGGLAASLTRTVQWLYRGSLRRQGSGTSSTEPSAAQLNERLNRAGITIPEGPDEAVAYFTPGREPRYNMPTQILLPANGSSNTSIQNAETASGTTAAAAAMPTSQQGLSRTAEGDDTEGAISEAVPISTSLAAEGSAGAAAREERGNKGDRTERCHGSLAEWEEPLEPAEASVTVTPDMASATVVPRSSGGQIPVLGTEAAAATMSVEAVGDNASPLAEFRTDSQSTSALLAELLSRRSCSVGGAGLGAGSSGQGSSEEAGSGGGMSAKSAEGPCSSSAAGAILGGEGTARSSTSWAADVQPAAEPSRSREGSAAVPDSDKTSRAQHVADSSAAQPQSPACATQVHPCSDNVSHTQLGGASEAAVHCSAAGTPSLVALPVIRSADTSRAPSRQTSMQLPGAADILGSGSGRSPQSALLSVDSLPPTGVLDGAGGGGVPRDNNYDASDVDNASRSPPLVELAQMEARPLLAELNAPDSTVGPDEGRAGGVDTRATRERSRGLSSGIGRMGAGARELFNNLRTTLQRTSGWRQAQVVPAGATTPSQSPKRSPQRRSRRNRTLDTSARAGRAPATGTGDENPVAAPVGAAGDDDGTEPESLLEVVRSPNSSHHRSSTHSHQHNLGARGVRVNSGRPHARVSLYGRLIWGNQPERVSSSPGNATSNTAPSRRRLPFRRPPLPAPPLDDGDAEQRQGHLPAAGLEAADSSGAKGGASSCAPDVLTTTVQPVASLLTGDVTLSSSFSSKSSIGGLATGGGADNDEEDVCPVCLDELPNLLVQTCRHQICMDCARDLVKRHSLTPALCPYCRGIISSFKARVAAGLPAAGSRT